MNKLLSPHTNAEIDRQVAELRKRGTGRTTAIALGLIAVCLANPGQRHYSSDHYHSGSRPQDSLRFAAEVRDQLAKLGLLHYDINACGDGRVMLKFTFMEADNG